MSRRLPSLKSAEVIRVLERNGFWRITSRKKHRIYTNGTHFAVVPYHNRDLKPGTLRSIIRQAGWSPEQFVEML